MADLNPKPEEVADKVPGLRDEFKKKHADSISKGTYDQRDVDRFMKDDAYARSFMRTLRSKGDIPKAVEVINDCFIFRKEYGVNDLNHDSFPADIHDKNAMYFKNRDKDGYPILYIDVKANTPTSDQIPTLKKYIAWVLDQHHRKDTEIMIVALFDMSKAGLGNMNIDITKYFITCFSTYYPGILAYMVNYEMPTLLAATWKIIKAFMTAEQNKKMVMCSKKDIQKYIPEDQLWDHMKK